MGSSAAAAESQSPTSTAERVVFILCIVFGSLLGCTLVAMAVYFTRRHKLKKHKAEAVTLRREASFQAGTPSVIDIISAPRPARRPSTRANTPIPRLAIPSPELGSVFRLDAVSNIMRRASSRRSAQRLSAGPNELSSTPTSIPTPRASSPRHESLFSTGSTLVASAGPSDKFDMPLRVINPSPHAPLHTITSQLQKPNPVYRGSPTPSRERLVTSFASADSLFSAGNTTTTPPLSPPGAWSHTGTNEANSPTEFNSSATSITIHKPSSQQSATSFTSSPHIAVECYEMSSHLMDSEHASHVLPVAQGPLSSLPPLERSRSAEELAFGAIGTPLTLSHFPFRFSNATPISPGLSSIAYGSPVPSSNVDVHSPALGHSSLNVPTSQGHGLGFLNSGSAWSLPAHSTPSLKLKIRHGASDQIIAIAFAPQSIDFQSVREAVHARLGFHPRRIWSNESLPHGKCKQVEIVDNASLWSWLDAEYTKGHTRLMLQVE